MASQRVTLEAIAQEAGVSYMTVARALSGKTKAVWPSVAKRNEEIRELASRLGYRTNSAARATATGRFGSVAFVMRAEQSDFFPFDLVRGICDTLAENDLHMVMARIPPENLTEEGFAPKIVREFAVDGLLMHEAIDVAPAVTEMIRRNRVPAIWINTKLPADAVYPDELDAAERATQALLDRGHRRIGYLDYTVNWSDGHGHYSSFERQDGYAAAMHRAELQPEIHRVNYPEAELPALGRPWGSSCDDRLERSIALQQRADRPTAFVTASPDSAGALLHAAATLGLDVPGDLSVVTFNHEVISYSGRAISTMVIPMLECGKAGVAMLMQKMDDSRRKIPAEAVRFADMQGQTVGVAR